MPVLLPQDSAAERQKPLQGAIGHYIFILLRRLAAVIDVLWHACGQDDWQLTKLN